MEKACFFYHLLSHFLLPDSNQAFMAERSPLFHYNKNLGVESSSLFVDQLQEETKNYGKPCLKTIFFGLEASCLVHNLILNVKSQILLCAFHIPSIAKSQSPLTLPHPIAQ